MADPLFRGSAVALVTPFLHGKLDLPALRRLVDFQIENGTAAIVACGTTGEPSTLTPEERETVVREVVLAAKGRIPIICGTGSNCTQSVLDTEKRLRGIGCAAQLVVTPYYNKTTQEG
ncbi:MAG: dihydrodipicolinate synthase family protein, partial [Clostridia bacterium]